MAIADVSARMVPWTAAEQVKPLMEELAPQFEDRERYEAWRDGTLASFITGFNGLVGLYAGDRLAGGLLVQGKQGLRTVLASLGAVEGEGLAAAFALLQAECELVVWDESVGSDWPERLAGLGARPFVRQTFVQRLEAVAFKPVPADGLTLVSWEEADCADEAVAVLAAASAGTLNGVFLTAPQAPTLAHCREKFERAVAGYFGAYLPWASFVAVEGGQVLGALLCVEGEHERQGMLYELGVAPAARGRQLSRRLVQAMQKALLARGYSENHFLTTAENTAVHRLFRPEEIVRYEEARGGYWARG